MLAIEKQKVFSILAAKSEGSTFMSHKNIVIAPCGNKADLFRTHWLKYRDEKEFDLCLLFYHEKIADPALYEQAEYFFHLKDFKWYMIDELFKKVKPGLLDQYDYFYFLDDDIEMTTHDINQMFTLSKAFRSSISQAALSQDSFCSWKIFKQQPNSFCRYVGQIEVMGPLFSRDALIRCLPSFTGNRSSWGIDSVWSKILGYPKNELIVFDAVLMRHTKPVGGGELYQKLGINPHDDWNYVEKKFDAKKHDYHEYGRLQLVNANSNRVKYFFYKFNEKMNTMSRVISDYGLMTRIRNKKNFLLKKFG